MATLNLTPNALIDAAASRTSEPTFRAAVNWDQATTVERIALQWLRRALHEALPDEEVTRWFTIYPHALVGASHGEYELLQLADCAVENNPALLH